MGTRSRESRNKIDLAEFVLRMHFNNRRLLISALEPHKNTRRVLSKRGDVGTVMPVRNEFQRLANVGSDTLVRAVAEIKQKPSRQTKKICSSGRLARVFDSLVLENFLYPTRYNVRRVQNQTLAIKALVYQAIVGAIDKDQGYTAAKEFVARTLLAEASETS